MILDLLINEVKDKSLTEALIKLKSIYVKLEEIIYQLDQCDIAYFIENQSIIEDYQYDLLKKEMYDLISKIREEMRSVEKIDLNQSNRDIIKRIFAHVKKIINNRKTYTSNVITK
jgi:NAD-dependent DNA ligase